MKTALKEWSTTIETLGKGNVVAVWKGYSKDIQEVDLDFKNKKFILIPTFENQDFNSINKEHWVLYTQNTKMNPDNQLKLKYWAEATDEISINSKEELLKAAKHLTCSEDYLIESAIKNNNDVKGKLVILRVYSLSNPILIPDCEEYRNQKTWVELKIDIPKIRSKSVLSFKDFNKKAKSLKSELSGKELLKVS